MNHNEPDLMQCLAAATCNPFHWQLQCLCCIAPPPPPLLLLQWSAVTVVIVSAPVVGRVARTGLERMMGTILGEDVSSCF
jgi:hypothetical protein